MGEKVPATCLPLRIDVHWQKTTMLAVGVNLPMTDCRSLVRSSSAHLLLLMTVLSPRLSGSESSFVELLMLIKLQQCEVVGSNYKVSCVRALWLILFLLCLREDCRDLLLEIFGTKDNRMCVCFDLHYNIVQYDWLIGKWEFPSNAAKHAFKSLWVT